MLKNKNGIIKKTALCFIVLVIFSAGIVCTAGSSILPDTVRTQDTNTGISNTAAVDKYTVRSGDTLYLIARKYGVTVSELKWRNGLKSDMIMPWQILLIPGVQSKPLKDIIGKGLSASNIKIDIVVDKSDHVLGVFAQGQFLKSYHVELGDGGAGDKVIAGDHKTPEGNFYIAEKSVLSPADYYLGSRWMELSYPNKEDADRGLRDKLINLKTHDSIYTAINNTRIPPQSTVLGGGIGIHGGSIPEFGSDWTWGCIGLKNKDVEDFYDYVRIGTNVTIQR